MESMHEMDEMMQAADMCPDKFRAIVRQFSQDELDVMQAFFRVGWAAGSSEERGHIHWDTVVAASAGLLMGVILAAVM